MEVQMQLSWFRINLSACILLAAAAIFTSGHAASSPVTIALPEDMIQHSLQDVLPLNIDDPGRHVEGTLILNSVSKLVLGENSAVLQGVVMGRNISIITRVGNQDLRIKVGDLQLPLTCDLTFRFDAGKKVFYVTPRVRPPAPGSKTDMASSVISLLTLFDNREYPVSLTSLKTLNAKVGNQDISVDMEPVDIRVSKGQLIVKMVPRFSKTN
jgi:hypothetical protein